MPSFLTQCPHCFTSFRVTAAQLDAAEGLVRCGACLGIFSADANRITLKQPHDEAALAETEPDADEAERHAPEDFAEPDAELPDPAPELAAPAAREAGADAAAAVSTEEDEEDAPDSELLDDKDFDIPLGDLQLDAEYEDAEADAQDAYDEEDEYEDEDEGAEYEDEDEDAEYEEEDEDAEYEEELEAEEDDDADEAEDADSAEFEDDELDETEVYEEYADEYPPPQEADAGDADQPEDFEPEIEFADEDFEPESEFAEDDADFLAEAGEALDDADAEVDDLPESPIIAVRPGTGRSAQDKTAIRRHLADLEDDAGLGPLDDAAALDSFDEPVMLDTAPRRSRLVSAALVLGSIALTLLLLLQVAAANIERVSRSAAFAPLRPYLCGMLECPAPERSQLDLLVTEQLLVRSHPAYAEALEVSLVFRNDAAVAQPFPALELNFSDSSGRLLANRLFTPAEYLPGELKTSEMPAQSSLQVKLELADPGSEAVNYTLVFRAP